ncbi:SIS domain-containing protein [Patescibacteria group bacterium]|nr:SIS domain-containing protein [Patescibacteria group bacterium]MBU4512391.1 SIS domain-containing protein [Patescibacteria group bacterium]MCG2692965.1 SIS domain-containing protein [Candidatus Parcubacteria bacterium]
MNTLSNPKKINTLDKSNVLGSIMLFDKQVEQAWEETKSIKIPVAYKKVKNLVINGMGGSGLGGHVIKSLYNNEIKIPFEVINDYQVPNYLNKNTLYLISSFSGNTEEPIGSYAEAKKRGAKIMAITTGGELSQMMQKNKIPGYAFEARHNICNQPRIAVAYSVIGQLALLNKCGIIKIADSQIKNVQDCLQKLNKTFGISNNKDNPAKLIAKESQGRLVILVAAGLLAGNVHAFANQINENSKNFASWFVIPELNHHLMEGLKFPKSNKKDLIFVFINSELYEPRVQKRFEITKDVVKNNKIAYLEYAVQAKEKLEQSFEVLSLGSYTAFYLAMLNNVNPGPIPWVDFFKQQLSQ